MSHLLERFAVRPRHVEAFESLWRTDLALRTAHGFTTHRAFLETDAEPKLSWLLEHPGGLDALAAFERLPECVELAGEMAPHVFRNRVVREVEPLLVTHASPESVAGSIARERIAIMRRYEICNGWDDFLAIWRQIVPVRERYGFRCLFAVADRPKDLFTWAFDFDGRWEDFPAAQHDYYHDPARVELRKVFDHMADYSLHPARQLLL